MKNLQMKNEKFDQALEKIYQISTDVALLKQSIMGNGVEGLNDKVLRLEKKVYKHESYFFKMSGASFLLGILWAILTFFTGGIHEF